MKIRHDWQVNEVLDQFEQPFNDLIFAAQTVHRHFFDPNLIQASRLLSIKTGACPEDCAYCSQSSHHSTGLDKQKLMPLEQVIEAAQQAKRSGATRFCMGAAWRNPTDKNLQRVIEMVKAVKSLGLETCLTLGMLSQEQAIKLKQAGLDYYNHNLDTSPQFYQKIISTRTYQDRLQTLAYVRQAGLNICSGGILGMGENRHDRAAMLCQLANLDPHPESVPINLLIRVEGTPLYEAESLDPFEFIRTIAVARIIMPASYIRLSAGRSEMNEQWQALCFLAGANSVFYGEKLLTTNNTDSDQDQRLFARLGLSIEEHWQRAKDLPGHACHRV